MIHYPFNIDLQDAKKVVGDELPAGYRKIKPYYEGDHWQHGNGWVGPMPKPSEDGYTEAMEEISKAFTSHNMVAEVVERHMMGIVGREPSWGFTPRRSMTSSEQPTAEERSLIDELEGFMTQWWDQRGIHQVMQDVLTTSLWASASPARLYVPKGLLREGTRGDGSRVKVIAAGDMEEALSMVYLAHHAPTEATVYTDPHSMKDLGVYLFQVDDGSWRAEVTFVTDSGMTLVAVLSDEGATGYYLDYGGRIPMFKMERISLISDQLLQSQRALNLALSMLPRNVVTGGFLERILLNAQMPGHWEHDEKGNRTKFVAETYYSGAGTTNFVRGVDYQDEDGKTHVTTPQAVFRDPVEVKPTLEAIAAHQQKILEAAKQDHVLTTSSQYQSGKSKEQARADFIATLNLTRNNTDQFGRWVLDTAVSMAEQFMGQPGRYSKVLRSVFSAKVDYGPLSFEERRQYNEAMDKGVLSRERNMHLQGIDDVDAEIAKINEERLGTLDMSTKQIELLSKALGAGLTPEIAARKAGFSEEEIPEIAAGIKAEQARKQKEQEALAAKAPSQPVE